MEPKDRVSILGEVVDALGEPVRACVVHLEAGTPDPLPIAKTYTDGEGQFVFDVSGEEAWYRVRASSAGRVDARRGLQVERGSPVPRVSLRLWDAGSILGTVVDSAGRPVAGAYVVASYDSSRVLGFEAQATGRTDDDGRFQLDGVPVGRIQVRAWKDGYSLAEESVELRDQLFTSLQLGTAPGVRVEVRVEGLPAGETATVRSAPYRSGSHRVLPEPLVAGSVGVGVPWIRTGLPNLDYRVSLSADGYSFTPDESRLRAFKGPHLATFVATPLPAGPQRQRIRGRLLELQGEPLAGERILIHAFPRGHRTECVTDAEGRFDVEAPDRAGTRCALFLVDSDHVVSQRKQPEHAGRGRADSLDVHEFEIGDVDDLLVQAAPAATVSGRVVDADGAPLRWATVWLQESNPSRNPQWMNFAQSATDRDGRFRFSGLHPPATALRVSVGPGAVGASRSDEFRIGLGEVVEDLSVVAARPGVVEGSVLDPEGVPVPGARVWLRSYDRVTGKLTDSRIHEVLADRRGRYRFPGVEPGWHRVGVVVASQRMASHESETFEVEPGATVQMPVRLR